MKPVMRRVSENSQLDRDNPWPGLDSYDESSHDFFSGRTEETNELLRRILDEPITVLFGKSGLGKTSLLKAGAFPRLREKGILPILVRLQIRITTEPLIEQVRLAFLDELRAQGIDHRAPDPGESLWEFMHRAGQEFWTRQNRLTRPVFVFDQFEELFTLGRGVPAEVAAFREDLADLAENRIPAAFARKLEGPGGGDVRLNLQTMAYKVVISLREDFLADLEEWRLTMPSLRRNRMRLLPMGQSQALQAVFNERTNHIVSKPLAHKIVAFLSAGTGTESESADNAGSTVEPSLLSLFCRGVNEHRKRDGKVCLDEALIEGAKGTIVTDFYRTSIADQPDRVRRFIEEELVTEHGFRNSYSFNDAIAQGFVTASELGTLIDRHLLRHEHHLGAERVELTHDLLTRAVVDERDTRRRLERVEQERRQRWKLFYVGGASVVLALIFGSVALLALKARDSAKEAEMDAREKGKRAETAEGLVKKNFETLQATYVDLEVARSTAERERNLARSRELAGIAATTMNHDPELAMALALEGLQRADTAEAQSALLDASRYAWPQAMLKKDQLGDDPDAVVLSPDGERLAVLASSKTLTVWNLTSRRPSLIEKQDNLKDSYSLAFSPDGRLLAVGRRDSIDLLDAATARPNRALPLPRFDGRRVLFSPDGRWLAWTSGDNNIQILDYRQEQAKPEDVEVATGVGDFAVSDGGKEFIVVSTNPLSAYRIVKESVGKPTSTLLNLSQCVKPQSISPGSKYFSATWNAHTCISSTTDVDLAPSERPPSDATEDIVWGQGGQAFADIRLSEDLVIGKMKDSGARFQSRIKGAHPDMTSIEKSRSVTVSKFGNRVAVIDEMKTVRIYSLADYKPFLSLLDEGSFAISPGGSWMAIAQPSAPDGHAVINLIDFDKSFTSGQRFAAHARIDVLKSPDKLYASSDSVIAQLPTQPPSTSVFDRRTGKPRFAPLVGKAQPLGTAGELLYVVAIDGKSARVVKTRDGSPVEPWTRSLAGEGPAVLKASPGMSALAVLRAQLSNATLANALIYSVLGDKLIFSAQARDLSSDWLSTSPLPGARSELFRVADNGLTIIGRTVQSRQAAFEDRQLRAASRRATHSPLGRFEFQTKGAAVRVVRLSDKFVLGPFKAFESHIFSGDERWLAMWNDDEIQIVDLGRAEIAFDLKYDDINNIEFTAPNILKVDLHDGTLLIPLERSLMELFSKWIAPRVLTSEERCLYGFGGPDCSKEIAPRAQSAHWEKK